MRALLFPLFFVIAVFDHVRCAPTISVKSVYSSLPTIEQVKFDLFRRKEPFNRDRMASNLRKLTRDQISQLFDKAIKEQREAPLNVLLGSNNDDDADLACEALGRALFGYHCFQSAEYIVSHHPQARKITPECFRNHYDRAFKASNFYAIKVLMHYAAPVTFDLQDVYELFRLIFAADARIRISLQNIITTDGVITLEKTRGVYQMAVQREDYALVVALLSIKKNNQNVIAPEAALEFFERMIANSAGNASPQDKKKIFGRVLMDAVEADDTDRVANLLAQHGGILTDDRILAQALSAALQRNRLNSMSAILQYSINEDIAFEARLFIHCLIKSAEQDSLPTFDLILRSFRAPNYELFNAFKKTKSYQIMTRLLNPRAEDQSRLNDDDMQKIVHWICIHNYFTEDHIRALTNPQNVLKPSRSYIESITNISAFSSTNARRLLSAG